MLDGWTWVKTGIGLLPVSAQNILQVEMHFKHQNQGKKVGKKTANGSDVDNECLHSTCAKYQGWAIAGIKKFNYYFDAVRAERESELGAEFEEALMICCLNDRNDSCKKPRKAIVEFECCRHELWN